MKPNGTVGIFRAELQKTIAGLRLHHRFTVIHVYSVLIDHI